MPTYEYRCENGHTFEVVQRMTDDPVTKCQVCGAPVQRVFHPVAVHFKGSGFYNTDYGKRKRGAEAGADGAGDGAKKETKAGSSSSDSSPSTKSGDGGDKAGKSKPAD
jgi:putative FmdB family regulatory protein